MTNNPATTEPWREKGLSAYDRVKAVRENASLANYDRELAIAMVQHADECVAAERARIKSDLYKIEWKKEAIQQFADALVKSPTPPEPETVSDAELADLIEGASEEGRIALLELQRRRAAEVNRGK